MYYNINVLVCNGENGKEGAELLNRMGFEAQFCEKDGRALFEKIKDNAPDAVIMPVYMPKMDAISVIEQTKNECSKVPVFIVTTSYDSEVIYNQVMNCGASYIMIEPFDYVAAGERIKGFLKSKSEIKLSSNALEKEITDILHRIGVPAHIKGYKYLRGAIMLTVKDDRMLEGVTKVLYPKVAKMYDSTPTRVERAIRHAIEIAWTRGEMRTINEFFGCTIESKRGKPTNSEFIAMISDRLSLKMKRLNS